MCIQRKDIYLPTCQPISVALTVWNNSVLSSFSEWYSVLNPASILGLYNKRVIRPAHPICFIFFSLYHFGPHALLSCLSPICLCVFFVVVFFTLSHPLQPPPPPTISSVIGPRCPAALEDHCTSKPPLQTTLLYRELGQVLYCSLTQGRTISLLIGVKDTGLSPNNRLARKCFL